MGKYAILGEEADRKIEEKLKVVINSIRKEIPSVLSIVLSGSFGYGQGSARIENNRVYPFNDFDIYVIIGKKVGKDLINDIAAKIAEKLNLEGINYFYHFSKEEQKYKDNFYIDLKIYSLKQWRNLAPRLRYYRLKENSQVLWGKDLRDLAPRFSLREIPVSESVKILLDRASQLIEYYSDDEAKYCPYYLTYIIQQAYAGCLTAILLPLGKYKPKYIDSAKVLLDIYPGIELSGQIPDLANRIYGFIEWRTNPQNLPNGGVKENWRICVRDVLGVLKYSLSGFLNKKIEDVGQLSKAIKQMSNYYHRSYLNKLIERKLGLKADFLSFFLLPLLNFYFKYKYFWRVKKISGKFYLRIFFNRDFPDLKIFSVAPLMLATKINGSGLTEAASELKKVYPAKGENWDEISLDYANAYIAFFLQKFI